MRVQDCNDLSDCLLLTGVVIGRLKFIRVEEGEGDTCYSFESIEDNAESCRRTVCTEKPSCARHIFEDITQKALLQRHTEAACGCPGLLKQVINMI